MSKKLEEYTRNELIEAVNKLKTKKKFGLVWDDKPENVAVQCSTNLPILDETKSKAIIKDKNNKSVHLIIEGDNYHSLSALNYTHLGKIDFIYIDPPYNTGKKDFIYNDSYVDKEDPYKHSKWLSFMHKRLKLAHSLLSKKGVMVVHIDEHEVDNLFQILVQVFGEENDLGRIIWDKRNPKGDSKGVSILNETILVFAKSSEDFLSIDGVLTRKKLNASQMIIKCKKLLSNIGKEVIPEEVREAIKPFNYSKDKLADFKVKYDLELVRNEYKSWLSRQNFAGGELAYKYIDDDGRIYRTVSMAWPNNKKAPDNYFIPLLHPKTNKPCPVPAKGWRNPPETMAKLIEKNLIVFGEDETKQPERKYYLEENMTENTPSIISYGGSDDKLFGELGIKFDNPKPLDIAMYLIESVYDTGTIVLDFFAGSGTAGHAVLELNKRDKGNRQFILCTNNENGIAENITYERISKVINGYGEVSGVNANLRYFKTAFVNKQKTDDQTRLALIDRCTDMIRVREDAYDFLIDDEKLKLLSSNDHNTVIIFDPHRIEEFFKKIEETDHEKPLNAYVFSYSSYTYDEDIPETKLQYTLCPIPESILEVYRRIFREDDDV